MKESPVDCLECEGLLFVGDPHLRSSRPGRRKERDFGAVVLGKLEQAARVANERRLVPVFLGDMFDRPKEEDEALKTRLLRILGGLWTPAYANLGNHDREGSGLSDADTLSVVAESGRLRVARRGGPCAEFLIGGVRVGLGMTPWGEEIPREVGSLFPRADGVVWATHHDLAFGGAYPGAVDPFEIAGCSLVVNGHMHLYKPPEVRGGTTWCNLGNITRKSVDAAAHEPAVWEFSPGGGLVRHVLAHARDVFDLTGRLVEECDPGPAGGAGRGARESAFVGLLEAEVEAGPAATPDGSLLLEEIEAQFERAGTPGPVRADILALFRAACGADTGESLPL